MIESKEDLAAYARDAKKIDRVMHLAGEIPADAPTIEFNGVSYRDGTNRGALCGGALDEGHSIFCGEPWSGDLAYATMWNNFPNRCAECVRIAKERSQ